MKAPFPPQEAQRLKLLRDYDILDTSPEIAFDDLAALAAKICDTPIALITLLDESRQWFKSAVGLTVKETSRDDAFCAHAILTPDKVMLIHDAQADERFADNVFVTSDPHIRFYAGAPLVAHEGLALGTLCVIDQRPRTLSHEQITVLQTLSRHVVAQLELRRYAVELSREIDERRKVEIQLRRQNEQFVQVEAEQKKLLELAEKSRRALLSILEDEQSAAKELRESEERFRQLADNIDEVFWIANPDKEQVLYVSPAYERIWGRTCESLYSSRHAWLEAIAPDDRENVRRAMASKQVRGNYDETYRIVHPDGSMRWIRDRAFPIRNAAGDVYRVVGTASDITAQRNLEAQFRQSQKMEAFGLLAGGIAHDFNNILSVVLGYSEMWLMKLPPDAPVCGALQTIKNAGERAAGLTRQLLAFSRKTVLEPKVLDINGMVDETKKMLARMIGEDIRISSNLDPRIPRVKIDPGQLSQVLINLAVNARDAMPQGGNLTFRTGTVDLDAAYVQTHPLVQPGHYVMLSISDTGSGMTPETLARIFEPFFTTKDVGKGTGLGLAVVHGVMTQSGGSIDVGSQVGVGTTFKLYFPASQDVSQSGTKPNDTAEYKGAETILVVDDESGLRNLAKDCLESFGYTVLTAESGQDALVRSSNHTGRIDLILTDVVMPGMSGRQLVDNLMQKSPKLKVIFMSGYTDDSVVRNGVDHEAVAFLQKPFSPFDLLKKVRAELETK